MKFDISLSTVKSHLNLDQDFTEDDILLLNYINIATNAVEANINGGIEEFNDKDCSTDMPSRVEGMVLLLVAEMYNNREMQTAGTLKQSPVWDMLMVSSIKFNQF